MTIEIKVVMTIQSFQCVYRIKLNLGTVTLQYGRKTAHPHSSLPCSLAMEIPRSSMIYVSHFMYTLTVSYIEYEEMIISAVADSLQAFPAFSRALFSLFLK